jgi:hypothetical protein
MEFSPRIRTFSLATRDSARYSAAVFSNRGEASPKIEDRSKGGHGAPRGLPRAAERKEQRKMAESKVQKVARHSAARKSIGTCQCGGELIWAQVIMSRPRMMKVCEKCGTFHEKGQ